MKTNQATEETKKGESLETRQDASSILRPKDAVRRILEAAGAEVPDREAHWLGCLS
jgi:hypothetical protein